MTVPRPDSPTAERRKSNRMAAGDEKPLPASQGAPKSLRTVTDGFLADYGDARPEAWVAEAHDSGIVPVQAINRGAAGHRRWQRLNRPEPPFVWLTVELLESAAWAAMGLAARRIVERVAIEHMHHGGTRNGLLIVTYDDFEIFGVRRKSIAKAIKEGVELGFLDVTYRGGRSYGITKRASKYGLTWLPRCDMTPPTNRWRSVSKRICPVAV